MLNRQQSLDSTWVSTSQCISWIAAASSPKDKRTQSRQVTLSWSLKPVTFKLASLIDFLSRFPQTQTGQKSAGVGTLTACLRLLVPRSDVICPSVTIMPVSVEKVNFRALYNEGWIKIGALPEEYLATFWRSRYSTWAIPSFGKESLAAALKSQAFVPAVLITYDSRCFIKVPGISSRFAINRSQFKQILRGPSPERRGPSQAPVYPPDRCPFSFGMGWRRGISEPYLGSFLFSHFFLPPFQGLRWCRFWLLHSRSQNPRVVYSGVY